MAPGVDIYIVQLNLTVGDLGGNEELIRRAYRRGADAGADSDTVWRAVRAEVTRVLAERGLRHVTVERGDEVPEQSAGGKYRQIIPLM